MDPLKKIKKCAPWLFTALFGLSLLTTPVKAEAAEKWISGFYPVWSKRAFPPSKIDFGSLSHIMIFSVMPTDTGGINDEGADIGTTMEITARAQNTHKKALITIGGGVKATVPAFRGATSPQYIEQFVTNILNLVDTRNLHGVDIDWEPIGPDAKTTWQDYTQYLELLKKLKTYRPSLIVTADFPVLVANKSSALREEDIYFFSNAWKYLDQVNIMSYDMSPKAPGWVNTHNSPLYGESTNHPTSLKATVDRYTAKDVDIPTWKLGIGVAFYGNCWDNVDAPYKDISNANMVCGDGQVSYDTIMSKFHTVGESRYDQQSHNPYLTFNPPKQHDGCSCSFISYENEASIAAKAHYVHQKNLGGTIIWQMEEGYRPSQNDPQSLLHSLASSFWQWPRIQGQDLPEKCKAFPPWEMQKSYWYGNVVRYTDGRFYSVKNQTTPGVNPVDSPHYWEPFTPCN